jgi:hypothetical protein
MELFKGIGELSPTSSFRRKRKGVYNLALLAEVNMLTARRK